METILLVEDEVTLRSVAAMYLRKQGYEVFEAGTVQEALSAWQEHRDRIQLLFTDVVLPGGRSGVDIASEFHKEKSSLRVILSSGDDGHLDSPISASFSFLPKPYRPAALGQAVRNALNSGK